MSSVNHYILAVRTTDPYSTPNLFNLVRAFKRQEDARRKLRDVLAALSVSVIVSIRRNCLQHLPGPLRNAMLLLGNFSIYELA